MKHVKRIIGMLVFSIAVLSFTSCTQEETISDELEQSVIEKASVPPNHCVPKDQLPNGIDDRRGSRGVYFESDKQGNVFRGLVRVNTSCTAVVPYKGERFKLKNMSYRDTYQVSYKHQTSQTLVRIKLKPRSRLDINISKEDPTISVKRTKN